MWAVIALIALLVLFIVFLSLPVDFVISLNTRRTVWFHVYLKWCFGLFHFNLRRDKTSQTSNQNKNKLPAESGTDFKITTALRLLGIRGIVRQIYILARDCLRTFRIKTLNIDFRIGLEDPVANGYLFACIIPFNHLLGRTRHNINIQTLFDNEFIFDGEAIARIRTIPIAIIGSVLVFIFSRPGFETIKILMDARWRRKKY